VIDLRDHVKPPTRIVYGLHPVEELLRRRDRQVQALFVARRDGASSLLAAAAARGIAVQTSSPGELDQLCGGGSHQGVAALVGEYAYSELEDLVERRDSTPIPLLVVLDSITDPQNVGAIIRSALVLGATGLVLPKDRAAPITPAVVRVSAGASEHLPCARVTNLARALAQLKHAELWVVGTVESGGEPPERVDLTGPVAIVFGSEQRGMRPLVRSACDLLVTIPSLGRIASLNVAAAATALLYEASRQRRASPGGAGASCTPGTADGGRGEP
jgi:23S rRNA (guanosine2251-2'-O)-methyltransferase